MSGPGDRVVPGSHNLPPAPWPTVVLPSPRADSDADSVIQGLLDQLNYSLPKAEHDKIAALFLAEKPENSTTDNGACGFWRDHLMLSWKLRTLKGRDSIARWLKTETLHWNTIQFTIDTSSPFRKPKFVDFRPKEGVPGVQAFLKVKTLIGWGRGVIRAVKVPNETGGAEKWHIWTLFTSLEGIFRHEELTGPKRSKGPKQGEAVGRKTWKELRKAEIEFEGVEGPDVVVIGMSCRLCWRSTPVFVLTKLRLGAGQAGLTAAARLKMLGVSTLIIEKNKAVGDSWRKRYDHLVLHDPVWYDHLPYYPFPESWPVFSSKDKIADWVESYAKALDLVVWTQTQLVSASWDASADRWIVSLRRGNPETDEEQTRVFHPKHIIFATGHHSGKAPLPDIPGIDTFQGDLLCHSSEFQRSPPNSKGKKAVVIGACTSGLDIAQEFAEQGYDVTVVQRSTTYVVSSDGAVKLLFGGLYEEGGPPVEDGDLAMWSLPSEILKAVQVDLTNILAERDKAILDGLERAGFKLDRGPNGAGLVCKYLQRGCGYYIDVGAAQMIADGKIKVKHGVEPVEVLPWGVKLSDGTVLQADSVVFATGYDNMGTAARGLLGDDLPSTFQGIWGWNEEGEMRGVWAPTGHPGLWFHGGNFALCRYYSRLVALQIKARLIGLNLA